MLPIQSFAGEVLADILRRQPHSRERTTFAWQVAVGPALARATWVDLADGVLTVRVRDARWGVELERAVPTILTRMQGLLGARSVSRIQFDKGTK
jgi:hypothetical protein